MSETLVRPFLAEAFDRHASYRIDDFTYQTNETMRAVADAIFALGGYVAHDVTKDGVTVFRAYAAFNVWHNTDDGKPVFVDGSRQCRPVAVELS